jgi:hypothetical protein
LHPVPPSQSLRAADGLAWAILFLGISIAFTVAALLLFILIAGPIDDISLSSSADTFCFFAYYAAQFTMVPVAFHRRKWWAWDAAIANLVLLWPCVPLLAAVLIAPSKPEDPTPVSLGTRIALGFLLAICALPPLVGSTRLLTRPNVRSVFVAPSGLPDGIRVVAAYEIFYAPFKFMEATSPAPQVLFGVPIPGWHGWLWSALVSGLLLFAGIGLYRRKRAGWVASLAAVVLVLAQGVVGLINPSLSSVPTTAVDLRTVINWVHVATAIAVGAPLLHHAKASLVINRIPS